MNIYKRVDLRRHPPIIGVDVSGGYNKDSSAITIIDSETTDVIGTLNCNYISIPELAKCIYELVVKYMPNAIVNIERTGVAFQQSQHIRQLVCFLMLNARNEVKSSCHHNVICKDKRDGHESRKKIRDEYKVK